MLFIYSIISIFPNFHKRGLRCPNILFYQIPQKNFEISHTNDKLCYVICFTNQLLLLKHLSGDDAQVLQVRRILKTFLLDRYSMIYVIDSFVVLILVFLEVL